LEAVHEATKIPMDALRAIEEGYTVRTLSSFYLKGFLKIYAQHLDVDPREIIDDYKQEVLPQHIKQEVEVFDIQQWLSQYLTRERKQQFIIVFGIIIALFVMFKIIAFIGHRASLRSVKQQAVGTKLIQKVAIVAKEEAIKRKEEVVLHPKIEPRAVPRVEQQPKFVSVPPVITEQQMQKNVTLTIRPRKDSWLSVKSDGVIVFQTTLKRGAVETWTADENIEISGKNINQLEFELNGKMIGPLGRKDRQAKRVVVTKDGLSVTK
jgi:cytoskeletal protein RodZ